MTKIIAFDLDGTLIDSAPDITFALNKVLVNNKLKSVSNKEVKNLIGNGAKALIIDSFKKQNTEINDINKLTEMFLLEYKKCFKNKTKLYKNVDRTLQFLRNKNYNMILVSNKPEYYVKKLLDHLNINHYFLSVSGGDTFPFRKPNPEHLFSTITKTKKFNNIQGIFVGDSKFDFMCAQNANWPCILFSQGYSDIDIEQLDCYEIFDDYKDLPPMINQIFENYKYNS